ncbi:ATP-binding protein [Actinomadura welshii]
MAPLTLTGWTAGPAADESRWLRVEQQSAAAGARREITALAERLGFAGERLGQVQLAVTEAATNLAKYAERGEMAVRIVREDGTAALEFVCLDHGPGIADVSRSRLRGYSSSGTLGLGLGAIQRLADHSALHSLPGVGTTLYARFRPPGSSTAAPGAPPPAPATPSAAPETSSTSPGTSSSAPETPSAAPEASSPRPGASSAEPREASGTPPAARTGSAFAGLSRPIDGETECGDAYAAVLVDGIVYAMLCDGLGHGPLAARAADEAVHALRETAFPTSPAQILERIHRRMRPTRGGAVAVAAIDRDAGRVRFSGLGNVSAWIVHPERRTGMISVPGIAGTHARVREQEYDLPPDAAVVLHSDGLTDRWSPADRPGLPGLDPLLIAATLLRDAGVRHDDRSVLAVTASEGR